MYNRYLLSAAALGLAGLLVPTAVSAAELTAETSYEEYYSDSSSISDQMYDSGSGSFAWASIGSTHTNRYAASAENGILGAEAIVFGEDRGGGGGGATLMAPSTTTPPPTGGADPTHASYNALSTWETSVTNNTGSAVDYTFLFHVYGPKLETSGNASNFAPAGLTIYLDSTLIHDASATLDGSSLGYSPLFTLNHNNGTNNHYQFADFDLALPLGTVGASDDFTLTYSMYANATGYFNADGSDTLAFAYIGDPFDLNQGPYTVSFITSPASGGGTVPEPASWAMLIAGFGVVGMVARRRRPATA